MKKSNVLVVAILVATACKCQPIARPMCDSLVIQDLAAHMMWKAQAREDATTIVLPILFMASLNLFDRSQTNKSFGYASVSCAIAIGAGMQFVISAKDRRVASKALRLHIEE